jgi:AraC-like DNA-binding protein
MMPKMGGRALCRALKQDDDLSYVPVILLTAMASQEDKIEGLSEGADDYATKPFNVEELRTQIENLIVPRQRLRDEFRAAAPAIHARTVDTISSDVAFLERVRLVIEGNLEDETFNVDTLADEVGLSRVHLYRRLRRLIDRSPSELIRTIRLERGAQLLAQEAGSISEVAYGVGFKSVSHFSRSFREHYGCTPSKYTDRLTEKH